MWEKIKKWYREFMHDIKAMYRGTKKLITAIGIVGSLTLAFHGHVFTAVVIAGVTYFFWKTTQGVDRLVGTCSC